MDTKVFLEAVDLLEGQGIAREITIEALKQSFESIFKKKGYEDSIVKVDIVPEESKIDIRLIKHVVESDSVEGFDDNTQIPLDEALEIKNDVKVGDDLEFPVSVEEMSRLDAMKFKSIFKQKIKEAEKAATYAAFVDKKGELINAVVEKCEPHYTLISIGNLNKTSVILSDKQKIGDERFTVGENIKVYVSEVNSSSSGPQIVLSRSDAGFLKRLFEEEVRDVYDGTVIIRNIARVAGERSKVAVSTTDPNVDPIGACIGQGGSKIQKICAQIGREKIDVVQYHEHQGLYIAESLKPATVLGVSVNEEEHSAIAVVKNDDLKIAIGKKGVNARLAVMLTGWKIDVKEQDEAISLGIRTSTIDEMTRQEQDMINEKRRAALLAEQEAENKLKEERLAEQEAKEAEVEEAPVAEEPVAEVEVETPVEEVKEETPVVEEVKVAPAPKKEKKEEEKVEFKPVNLDPSFSLSALEKEIEEEKKKKNAAPRPSFRRDDKKDEEKVETKKVVDNRSFADVYTEEELAEMEEEEKNAEESRYDDEIDYDDFDEYYDDDK